MRSITFWGMTFPAWLYAPVLYFVWVSILLAVKNGVFRWLSRIYQKTASRFDDILVNALNFPVTLLIFISGAFILEHIVPFENPNQLTSYFAVGLRAAVILSIIFFLDKLLNNLIKEYSHRVEVLRSSGGIVQGCARVLVVVLGVLILLDTFGLSITPILASLGIGSLAVALALQPTLENFFSGLQIIADGSIKIGQFIRLDSGEEGYVEKLGWRATWVRMLSNNTVIVPNKILVNSRVLNYYYPQKEMAVLVEVGVSYESDLAFVEKVTIEVAEEVLKTVPGAVSEFMPFIRFHDYSDSSVDFTVILRGHEFVDQHLIKHEFIKRLHSRYQKEGIVIPFRSHTVEIKPDTLESLRTIIRETRLPAQKN